jgi:hypothetical protein
MTEPKQEHYGVLGNNGGQSVALCAETDTPKAPGSASPTEASVVSQNDSNYVSGVILTAGDSALVRRAVLDTTDMYLGTVDMSAETVHTILDSHELLRSRWQQDNPTATQRLAELAVEVEQLRERCKRLEEERHRFARLYKETLCELDDVCHRL